jgi:hypothetical protein
MTVGNFSANGESHAGPAVNGISGVEPLERFEDFWRITFLETDAVVFNHNPADGLGDISVYFHDGRLRFFPVFYRIFNDVLKELAQQGSIGLYDRQFADFDPAVCIPD